MCHQNNGPSFGDYELLAYPNGTEKELKSFVESSGYKIPGKHGEINPLTGDLNNAYKFSESNLKELEVWEITFLN